MRTKNIEIQLDNYSPNGENPNTHVIKVGNLMIYFSYTTPVAFRSPNRGLVVCENVWSSTTGKHLNWIRPNKSMRIPYDLFSELLEQAVTNHLYQPIIQDKETQ